MAKAVSVRVRPSAPKLNKVKIEKISMLMHYFPILVFIALSVMIGVIALILSTILGAHKPTANKEMPYECGFDPFSDARLPFDIRYYLIAILFILFDLETAFLFPWAVSLRHIGSLGFWGMVVFLMILVVGFIYEWKKGALEWE